MASVIFFVNFQSVFVDGEDMVNIIEEEQEHEDGKGNRDHGSFGT